MENLVILRVNYLVELSLLDNDQSKPCVPRANLTNSESDYYDWNIFQS